MSSETSPVMAMLYWLWNNGATGVWGALCVWLITKGPGKLRVFVLHRMVAFKLPSMKNNFIIALARKKKLQNLKLFRIRRLDTAWINREVSRGHSCQIIFFLWFGLWILSIGIKDMFMLTPELPLAKSPHLIWISSGPIYIFEIMWIFYSGRAARLLENRQKIRIKS